MNHVYELISVQYIGNFRFKYSEGLFSTKELAEKQKKVLESYNADKEYIILIRVVH